MSGRLVRFAALAAVCGSALSPAAPPELRLLSHNGKWGQAVADNLSAAGRTPNSLAHSASPGQEVALSASGLRDAPSPTVYIAGKPAPSRLDRHGDAEEIVFRVPADAPEGCAVPVEVRAPGRLPSNMVSLAIHAGGGECQDATFIPFAHWPGSRAALFLLVHKDSGGPVPSEEASAWFVKLGPGEAPVPPPGTCTSLSAEDRKGVSAAPALLTLLANEASASLLDAGPFLTLDDARTIRRLRPVLLRGYYDVELAGPRIAAPPLRAGEWHVAGRGGGDVGAFQFRLRPPEPLTLSAPITEVDRSRGLSVAWRAAPEDAVVVALSFGDTASHTHGVCLCVAPPGASGLTIAPEYLARFPAIPRDSTAAQAVFTIATWPGHPTVFQATGLDHGIAAASFVLSHSIAMR